MDCNGWNLVSLGGVGTAQAADRITDLAQVQAWFKVLNAPSKRLEVVPGAAHLSPFEQPERFVTFLEAVRTQILGSSAGKPAAMGERP